MTSETTRHVAVRRTKGMSLFVKCTATFSDSYGTTQKIAVNGSLKYRR